MKKINMPTPKYHEFAVQSVKDDVAKMESPMTKTPAEYYDIAFDTKKIPGTVTTVRVKIYEGTMFSDDEETRIDLCDHPLYPALEEYVRNNPSEAKEGE